MAQPENPNIMHRTGTASSAPGDLVSFERPVHTLYINATAGQSASFDGGAHSFPLLANTIGINKLEVPGVVSFRMVGSGTYNILGIAR